MCSWFWLSLAYKQKFRKLSFKPDILRIKISQCISVMGNVLGFAEIHSKKAPFWQKKPLWFTSCPPTPRWVLVRHCVTTCFKQNCASSWHSKESQLLGMKLHHFYSDALLLTHSPAWGRFTIQSQSLKWMRRIKVYRSLKNYCSICFSRCLLSIKNASCHTLCWK